jgi:hypothetical protein
MGQILRRDTDAGVRDGEGDPLSALLRRDEHRAARRGVAERVLHEVSERLPQSLAVRLDRRQIGR